MRKLLLLTISLCLLLTGYSQKAARPAKEMKETVITLNRPAVQSDEVVFGNISDPTVRQPGITPAESVLGDTKYDLQTNRMVQGRIYAFPDGTVGAVWTRGIEDESFPDRGTGYNYYDGAQWGAPPTARIESVRTGWPTYAPWGPNGEIVFSHDYVTTLYMLTRENKGTGDWQESLFPGNAPPIVPSWPRVATGGENHDIIHLIYNSKNAANDQTTALYYARSMDEGANWDILNQAFEEFGPNFYSEVGGDAYAIAAKGSTVAILICDTWLTDLAFVKSTDNGDTWEKTTIWEHPYPFYDWDVTLTDTFFAPDGAASIAIDNNGKVHVAFGMCGVQHSAVGTTYSYWPWAEGIGYWNEDMPVFGNSVDALCPPTWEKPGSMMVEDYNWIGYVLETDTTVDFKTDYMLYRTIGLCSMPNISIDENNDVFIAYSAIADGFMNATYNYRHIWTRAYANSVWGEHIDLNTDIVHIFDECIYPVLSESSDDNIHLIYSADQTPGLALDTDHSYVLNTIYYDALPKSDLITGIKHDENTNMESVSQNYPNPFTENTTIKVDLQYKADLCLVVTNILGQQVASIDKGIVPAGAHYFDIDGRNWDKGIYFYTVKTGNQSVTKKMILR